MLVDGPNSGASSSSSKKWPEPLAISENIEDGADIPEYFICSISGCIMSQPAVTPDGVTYDYESIKEWLKNKKTDPTTCSPLTVDQLYPNRTIRSMIEDWIEKGDKFLTMKKDD